MPRAKEIAAVIAAVALSASVLARSLDAEGVSAKDDRPPDTVATGLCTGQKNSRTQLELTADRRDLGRTAPHRDRRRLRGVRPAGTMAVEGSAGRVVFHTDTEDAEISGRVRVYSALEEAGIETEALAWKSKPRLLTAPAHDRVIISSDNGSRLETYVIKGKAGSGEIILNGAAARKGQKGDLLIIIAYGLIEKEQAASFKPAIVIVDENNRPVPR
jgi:hypothetical protein